MSTNQFSGGSPLKFIATNAVYAQSAFLEFCLDSRCLCMAPLASFSAARSLADSSCTRKEGPASSSNTRGVEASGCVFQTHGVCFDMPCSSA